MRTMCQLFSAHAARGGIAGLERKPTQLVSHCRHPPPGSTGSMLKESNNHRASLDHHLRSEERVAGIVQGSLVGLPGSQLGQVCKGEEAGPHVLGGVPVGVDRQTPVQVSAQPVPQALQGF